jgi:hypothetical protein
MLRLKQIFKNYEESGSLNEQVHLYGVSYIAILSVNVFAAAFILIRKFFLKDTGRKLSHLDKQLHVGQTEMPAPGFEEESD